MAKDEFMNVLKQNLAKLVGIFFCIVSIVVGVVLRPGWGSQINNDGKLTNAIFCLEIALIEKIMESNEVWDKIKGEFKNCNYAKYADFINQYTKNTTKDKKIEDQIKRVEEYINFQKKIKLADIFFNHVLKLIFILSGIFGLFWISIWKYREEREGRKEEEDEKRAEEIIEEIKRKLESK
jgi:hypothetical protein